MDSNGAHAIDSGNKLYSYKDLCCTVPSCVCFIHLVRLMSGPLVIP